ncbi:hypothetical protein BSP109_02211 [Brevibacterium sp. Mu109]|uniref:hypothetical protein n=1 Tax=Brevibacterium sp. Mu109 TaxID=1255669 RepID=UPI000C4A8747|nr:hypothetical protein [Brevibacterium sp. Mu109]MDN5894108.1 hypothetical protein [Nocardioides sp.]SMX87401.1 hypothetical protein BSP109_02211 [Brevibacterium sp. Mu109]
MTMQHTGDQAGHQSDHRSPEEIANLFDVVGREGEAIRQLSGCVEDLRAVQAAKQTLSTVSPAQVRAALEYRRATVSESA